MELRTLRYFAAIAHAGSVTAAATVLHVTQPSLSRQMRLLERHLGMDLFVRDGGGFRLSAAGAAFLPAVERLLAQAERTRTEAAAIAAGRLEHLTIAAPGTTLTDVVAPFLATLSAGDPMPAVRATLPASAYSALDSGADLAIGTTPWPAGYAGMALADLPVWAYVPQDHPWANGTSVSLAELAAATLLLQTADYHPRRALDHAVDEARLVYATVHEFTSAEVAQAVAASGRGIAVVSDDTRFGLRPLNVLGPNGTVRISLYAAWSRNHYGADAIAALTRRLAAFCVSRYGAQVAPVLSAHGRGEASDAEGRGGGERRLPGDRQLRAQ
ncbi:LysR substrate-binding domain-containing protein [Winogradskya consettensis]|uniref:LysR family transcriptional regulator n=1 Tax=Winogradskya consettensis TaxID=113560 RepID=UPI001BB317BF|nr:LysR family transcriptional regulator [Actinoplanes consettensis]